MLPVLALRNLWRKDGHRFARWSARSGRLLRNAKQPLLRTLQPALCRTCMHVKGSGGVKRAVRIVRLQARHYPWAVKFDIASYYKSIDHHVLLDLLTATGTSPHMQALVADYLQLPDKSKSGKGMVAGGAISPLLGALYLYPLDKAMEQPEKKGRILYRRFMDDFIILAKSRHTFKSAIRTVHRVLADLKLTLHPVKRFIGRTEKGFDFLGYQIHPDRKLCPSATSLHRLTERARRLYEQGASIKRLRQYVTRWHRWLLGGLDELVTTKGGVTKYWVYVLKHLHISGATVRT
ncbi:MAG: hypothetical protein HGB02_08440 [Chlorobiaceae bacterium]|nr:hypothetical protein [Chlorobiaceae bacterium]